MNINDLHDIRDGASVRRRRSYNPFIHLAVDTPLMQMLFQITRPGGTNDAKPAHKQVVRKKVVRATTIPAGAMVPYATERTHEKL